MTPQSIKESADRIAANHCTRFMVHKGAQDIAAALRTSYATGYAAGLRDARVAAAIGDSIESVDWGGVAKLAEGRLGAQTEQRHLWYFPPP